MTAVDLINEVSWPPRDLRASPLDARFEPRIARGALDATHARLEYADARPTGQHADDAAR